jgi:hypothetical protein
VKYSENRENPLEDILYQEYDDDMGFSDIADNCRQKLRLLTRDEIMNFVVANHIPIIYEGQLYPGVTHTHTHTHSSGRRSGKVHEEK